MNLNKLSEIIREYTGNMINEHGFYIPLEQYHFIFWKDLVIYVLTILLFIYILKNRYLKKKLKENKEDTVNNIEIIQSLQKVKGFLQEIKANI